MKRVLACFLVVILAFGAVSCGKANQEPNDETSNLEESVSTSDTESNVTETTGKEEIEKLPVKTYKISDSTTGIKVLGERHLASTEQLNCDWTGSGLELNVYHTGGNITFNASATANCYFRAYVDGEVWNNADNTPYYTVFNSKTKIVLQNVPAGDHVIKLIKVTGYTIARAEVLDVTFAGTIKETAPADKELYIEFVGDSICCAWGTIGTKDGKYTGQDGTVAYPLMVAEALNADYSVTALSGQGLVYCGAPNPNMQTGYLYGSSLRSTEAQYAFERKADIVVVNIGTNDYNKRATVSADDFGDAYLEFLKTIKEKNGEDCIIYCLYNTMNNTFFEEILAACEEFGGEAKNVYTVKMIEATRGASDHPSLEEHEYYAEFLTELLKEKLGN